MTTYWLYDLKGRLLDVADEDQIDAMLDDPGQWPVLSAIGRVTLDSGVVVFDHYAG